MFLYEYRSDKYQFYTLQNYKIEISMPLSYNNLSMENTIIHPDTDRDVDPHTDRDVDPDVDVETESKPSFVYLLVSSDEKATYVGATIDLDHRLRQHNKEIKGGAHATSVKVGQGKKWRRACYVSGFPNWQAALQFEWRWKQLGRKRLKAASTKNMKPLDRRMLALQELLALSQSTTKAIPYAEWKTPPQVHMENTDS